MKKSFSIAVVAIILLVAFLFTVNAKTEDADGDGVPDQLSEENLKNKTDATIQKIKYLSDEWKKLLLKNSVVSFLDTSLRKINPVFLIFFGQSYDLTLPVMFVIIVWFIIFFKSASSLKKGAGLKPLNAYLASFAITLLLAQIGLIRLIAKGFVYFLYSRGTAIQFTAVWGITILVLVTVIMIWTKVNKTLQKKREQKNKKKAERSEREMIQFAKDFRDNNSNESEQ